MTKEHFDHLVALGSFEALAATAILAKLPEEAAAHELYGMVLYCYAWLQTALADAPETGAPDPGVFTFMDKVCQHW
ncbi:hypothetical protein [Chitinimonas prasina]|uniref:hypothetical protein n=1 Tax=Chitinimonas prasina TaxID=1434937 RepID=UPI0024E190ED|nr:hypothetical protein [Chitinimonas prasina]